MMSNSGSGLFSNERATNPSSFEAGKSGMAGELGDLRRDIQRTLAPLAAIAVEEFTNALAAAANNVMAATASVATARTLLPAATPAAGSLTQATVTNLANAPRQLVFTTAGTTPANQPASATIYGKDERGKAQVETVALAQTAAAATSTKFFSDVEKIELPAGEGAAATLAIGLGAKIGLSQKIRARAGLAAVIREIAGGAVVTTGTIGLASVATNGTYGSYTPFAALDGAVDFALYYEYDPTA
jgi:hypothetical protein